ncbi:hypothetical protein LWI28_015662 [Acer negundo]|uniref:Transmembrane protein n=1 Tax=Acer negundo TaxID=4023 RepID=A0AAD5JDI1_ACENE|nr:hypothetical protein LWI28_015662 [Acer negundo]
MCLIVIIGKDLFGVSLALGSAFLFWGLCLICVGVDLDDCGLGLFRRKTVCYWSVRRKLLNRFIKATGFTLCSCFVAQQQTIDETKSQRTQFQRIGKIEWLLKMNKVKCYQYGHHQNDYSNIYSKVMSSTSLLYV